MKVHTGKRTYLLQGASALETVFSLARARPHRHLFTDTLCKRLEEDIITPESWDALQAHRKTRNILAHRTALDGAAPYTINRVTNALSLSKTLKMPWE